MSIPDHVAIIMDGNGRWARERMMPRYYGHRAGVKALKQIVKYAGDIGIRMLTVYAFSTENWKRPAQEVKSLMQLMEQVFSVELDELAANGVRVRIIGDRGQFLQNSSVFGKLPKSARKTTIVCFSMLLSIMEAGWRLSAPPGQ